ncbi:beta strand repeat-containing protein [Bdellovibrio sp. HCB288]|uniref:beta strand repeat-containing protein n=1 Tax=Bdellovibrio sp. HCB288 TaxID=3394355 RepID=UPI0039B48A49
MYVVIVFLSALLVSSLSHADESWTGVTKTPGDYTSAGIVTISGAVTLTPGTYTFTTLIVSSGQTLTIQGDTAAGTGVIINANTVTVSGTINGDGAGYTTTPAPGAGVSAPTGSAAGGGCHGGLGGFPNPVDTCDVYGDPLYPTTLGSPGKANSSAGAGGGAIKFDVSGTMTVSGTIRMNGTDSTGAGVKGGAGSGGSIWIKANTLAGNGNIRANGASSANDQGPGGGGRVAIHYSVSTFSGGATATAGTSSVYGMASEGSVWWIDYTNNDLLIKTQSTIPNGTYNFRNVTIQSGAGIWNNCHGGKPQVGSGAGATIYDYGSGAGHGGRGGFALIAGGGTYGSMLEPITQGSGGGTNNANTVGGRGGGAIKLVLTGTLTVNGYLSSEGCGGWYYNNYYPGGGSGGSIWIIAQSVAGSGSISVRGGNGGYDSSNNEWGGAGAGGRIAIYYSDTISSSLTYNVSVGVKGWKPGSFPGSAVIINTTTNDLTFPVTSSVQNGTYSYNNVTLASGAVVKAIDGQGPNTGTGKGTSNGTRGGGGGYGGAGGSGGSGAAGGTTYGSNTEPVDLGSGGGGCTSPGIAGTGGGALKFIVGNTLTINTGAVLSASGSDKIDVNRCGGGSGGSIWIQTKNLTSVTDGIVAQGGSGFDGTNNGGGGGGGRIAIYYSGSYSGTLNVSGGTGNVAGSTGTTYLQQLASVVPWFFRGY